MLALCRSPRIFDDIKKLQPTFLAGTASLFRRQITRLQLKHVGLLGNLSYRIQRWALIQCKAGWTGWRIWKNMRGKWEFLSFLGLEPTEFRLTLICQGLWRGLRSGYMNSKQRMSMKYNRYRQTHSELLALDHLNPSVRGSKDARQISRSPVRTLMMRKRLW